MAKDKRKGYRNGGKCPDGGGLIQIRSTLPPGEIAEYAQCSKCSWNSLR
jgi:hypothetical protein